MVQLNSRLPPNTNPHPDTAADDLLHQVFHDGIYTDDALEKLT